MPLPVIANTYRCAFDWVNDDQSAWRATNVMHFRGTIADSVALGALLGDSVTAGMWFGRGSHSHVSQVVITPLDGTSASYTYVTGSSAAWSGDATANDANPQVANIIKLVTLRRGRSYRGRVFLPWCDESRFTDGKFSADDAAAVTADWDTFLTAMATGNAEMVVASYKLASAEAVSLVVAERDTATQRRRNSSRSSL